MKAIIAKELRDVTREKSIIVAFLVQAFLAGFSALLLTGLSAIHDPATVSQASEATVAYVGEGGFDSVLLEMDNLDVRAVDSTTAMDAFRAGSLDAVIEEQVNEIHSITIVFADGEVTSTILVSTLKDALLVYEEQLRIEGQGRLDHEIIPTTADAPSSPFLFVYATLLPLLVITPVFLSGAIAGDALSQESRSRTLLLLRSAPISTTRLILGKLTVPILLVPIQVALWLLLFLFNGYATPAPLTIIGVATVMGVLLTSLGTLVAVMVRQETLTQAGYAMIVLLLAGASLVLPQDPLNLLARLATDSGNATSLQEVVWIASAAAASLAAAILVTRRSLRKDLL